MKVRSGAAPARIAVEAGWELSCPWHGRVNIDRCRSCTFLQGTLDGPDLVVLCGFAHEAPLRRPLRVRASAGAQEADR
jgi:predicted RNA-binding Zn-ribbon protein involved in translation (DUF1610 family)